MTDRQTGIIGLGAMGMPMALNLHAAGRLNGFWNRSPDKAAALQRDTGLTAATDPAALAGACRLLILSLSRDQDVQQVIAALRDGLQPGTTIVDTSTISSDTARQLCADLATRQVAYLDAPVSGGVEGAQNGTLAMMVGGDEDALDRVRPVLAHLTRSIIYMGDSGNGQATKAVNQIMAAGINQAVTEALAFGQAMGLDMQRVIDVVAGGAAGNWFLEHRGRSMVEHRYPPGFRLDLHHKDLEICRTMARQQGAEALPVIEMTLHHYGRLMQQGRGDEDISALFDIKQQQYEKDDE